MTAKPASLSRSKILAFGLALVAAGLFTPIYQTAESVFGVEETKSIFAWILSAKEAQEAVESNTNAPPVVVPPVVPDQPEQPALVDDLDISNAIEVCSNSANNVGAQRAKITHAIDSIRWDGNYIYFKNTMPQSWRNRSKAKEQGFMRNYAAWQEGGQVYMGHFDWSDKHTKKETKNISNGYLTRRPVGKVYFFIVSNDGRERTNVKASQ